MNDLLMFHVNKLSQIDHVSNLLFHQSLGVYSFVDFYPPLLGVHIIKQYFIA